MDRYIIEPQRAHGDAYHHYLKGVSSFSYDYCKCSPTEAEIWAVYREDKFGLTWRCDFKTRGLAEQYLKQLGV